MIPARNDELFRNEVPDSREVSPAPHVVGMAIVVRVQHVGPYVDLRAWLNVLNDPVLAGQAVAQDLGK